MHQGLSTHPAELSNLAQLQDTPQPQLGAILELSNQRCALGDFIDDLRADKDLKFWLAPQPPSHRAQGAGRRLLSAELPHSGEWERVYSSNRRGEA